MNRKLCIRWQSLYTINALHGVLMANKTLMKGHPIIILTVLVGAASSCTPGVADKQDSIFSKLAANDIPVPPPGMNDWLSAHKEPGQTFAAYQETDYASPGTLQKVIYLVPVGAFTTGQQKVLQYTADFLSVFFALKTVIADHIPEERIPLSAKRKHSFSGEQFLAPYLLDTLLPMHRPKDAFVIIAITAKDLYPAENWNYVFGMASYEKRTGVSSLYRYYHPSADTGKALERLIQTSAHEIGHMLSMHHCIHAMCIMNGSNNLDESDRQPNRLCSECLQKLHFNLKFDIYKRLQSLNNYFKIHHLDSAYGLTQKDLRLITSGR